MAGRLSSDLQRALARIPERQRAALLLAELHDLTGLELAGALGVSHVAARALLTRARDSLRRELAARTGRWRPRPRPGPTPGTGGPPDEPADRPRAGPRPSPRAALTRSCPPTDEAALEATWPAAPPAPPWPPTTKPIGLPCGRCRRSSRRGTSGPAPSVGLEREHAHGPKVARRLPRRWGPVAVLGSGVALVLVIVIVGPTLIGPSAGARAVALASTGPVGPAGGQPAVTPLIAVDAQVQWVVTKGPQGLSIVTADMTGVCPTGDEPACPPVVGVAAEPGQPADRAERGRPCRRPNGSQAIAAGPSQDQAGTSLYVLSVAGARPAHLLRRPASLRRSPFRAPRRRPSPASPPPSTGSASQCRPDAAASYRRDGDASAPASPSALRPRRGPRLAHGPADERADGGSVRPGKPGVERDGGAVAGGDDSRS